jgi:uncharacterized protein (TIGR03067 family)
MLLTKLKVTVTALSVVFGIAALGGLLKYETTAAQQAKSPADFARPEGNKPETSAKDDQEILQGIWHELLFEQEGLRMDEGMLKNTRVVIADDTISFGDNRRFHFKLDPTKTPKQIHFARDGESYRGIYKVQRVGLLDLCYVPTGDAQLPTDFIVPKGSARRLIRLKRESEERPPPAKEMDKEKANQQRQAPNAEDADRELPWGVEVEGLQCRLRANKPVRNIGDIPAFKLEVRNLGKRDLEIHMAADACEVEFDGKWYRWQGPVSILSGRWPAGRRYDDFEIPVTLGERWTDKLGKPMAMGPGKHTVRVAYLSLDRERPVRVVSNAVGIVVTAASKDERPKMLEATVQQVIASDDKQSLIGVNLDRYYAELDDRGVPRTKLPVSMEVEVLIDGKKAKLTDLAPGDRITMQLSPDHDFVTKIELTLKPRLDALEKEAETLRQRIKRLEQGK